MGHEYLLSGYVLRITVRHHRWVITLMRISTGEVRTFDTFEALMGYLEDAVTRLSQPPTPKRR